MHLRLALALSLILAATATAAEFGAIDSRTDVPTGVANVQTDSCSANGCTATATCTAGTIVVSAVSRQDNTDCASPLSGLTGSFIRLDCYGQTSCAQTESGLSDAACVRASCAPN